MRSVYLAALCTFGLTLVLSAQTPTRQATQSPPVMAFDFVQVSNIAPAKTGAYSATLIDANGTKTPVLCDINGKRYLEMVQQKRVSWEKQEKRNDAERAKGPRLEVDKKTRDTGVPGKSWKPETVVTDVRMVQPPAPKEAPTFTVFFREKADGTKFLIGSQQVGSATSPNYRW